MKVHTLTDLRRRSQTIAESSATIISSGATQAIISVKHVEQGKSVAITLSRDEVNAISRAFDEADKLMGIVQVGQKTSDSGSLV